MLHHQSGDASKCQLDLVLVSFEPTALDALPRSAAGATLTTRTMVGTRNPERISGTLQHSTPSAEYMRKTMRI